MEEIREIIEHLRETEKILLLSHVRPDYDTIASMLALKLALEKVGKEVTAYNEDGAPPSMRFLAGVDDIVRKLHPRKRFDTTIMLDAGSLDRFGDRISEPKVRERMGVRIKIDHHLTSSEPADLEYVDAGRASTAEMVWDVIRHYPIELNRDIAANIYCAVVSDTGGFRYSNTNARAFACAQAMMEHGVEPWEVTTRLYESRPLAELRLLGEALQTLDITDDGRFASLSVTREAMEKTGAENYMLDGFVNFARSIDGVEVGILLQEMDGLTRISFRSKGRVNVAEIAARFGGGGHHNAAGARIEGALPDVKKHLGKIIGREIKRKSTGKAPAKNRGKAAKSAGKRS